MTVPRSIKSWRSLAVVVATALAVTVGFIAAPADAETVEIPITEVAVQGDPGSLVDLGQADVDESLQGRSCAVSIVVTNQVSEHPGNQLVVSSGDSQIVVDGIEDEANAITEAAGTLTLGSTITVQVKLGNSNITSLGSSLTVTCEPLPETPPPPPVPTDPPYAG